MASNKLNLIAILVVVALAVVSNSIYVINERERAVLLKLVRWLIRTSNLACTSSFRL